MSDLAEVVLQHVGQNETVDSLHLSNQLQQDHQKIVGAIKSIQALGDGQMVSAAIKSKKTTDLTDEGKQVLSGGSHEAVVWKNVPAEGIDQKNLMKNVGAMGKVGFSKAMQAGWIKIDKEAPSGPLVRRTKDDIDDSVQEALKKISALKIEDVDEKLRGDLKKRKLVVEVETKYYELSKGPSFNTVIAKAETDLTAEMIQDGSWRTKTFKPYNFNALGIMPPSGYLHPLLKVRTEFRQIFLEMGFTEMPTNNFIESSFWNFDALFQPQQHPARDAHDTFFISDPATTPTSNFPPDYLERVKAVHSKGGFGSQGYQYDWKEEEAQKNLLRTHTTAVSARMLYKLAQKMGFGNCTTTEGQQSLNDYLACNSYIDGSCQTQGDRVVFDALNEAGFVSTPSLPHLHRWFTHISSFSSADRAAFPGVARPLTAYGPKNFQPAKYFSIDRVFRNETLDATHLAEFHQVEGVIADVGLTLGDLIGVLYAFFKKLGIEKLRFKPAYNPYTEPSMEIFSYHEGLNKWVEVGNSGVFRPEMILPMGLPEDVAVVAWGLSLERPTMIKYGYDNIRDLIGPKVDLEMVQRNPLCRLEK